jgi:hypothetical protein
MESTDDIESRPHRRTGNRNTYPHRILSTADCSPNQGPYLHGKLSLLLGPFETESEAQEFGLAIMLTRRSDATACFCCASRPRTLHAQGVWRSCPQLDLSTRTWTDANLYAKRYGI